MKTSCKSCGVAIQDWVAEETAGLCRPCVAGRVDCVECGTPMMRQPVIADSEHVCIPCRKKTKPKTIEIEYSGILVAKDWVEKIETAQLAKTVVANGKRYPRIKYGSETDDDNPKLPHCGDCAVATGQYHVGGCDIEECPSCHQQLLSCGCADIAS